MKCENFKQNIVSLIEADENTPEMIEHMTQCTECADYYRQFKAAVASVTPRELPVAPPSLLQNVRQRTAYRNRFPSFRFDKRIFRITAAAVCLLAIVATVIGVSGSEARAAVKLLDKSLGSIGQIRSMEMTLNVRSYPRDNFSAVNTELDMIPYKLTVLTKTPMRWRVEKEGRTIVCDGEKQSMWITDPLGKIMGAVIGGANAGFLNWFKVLLDPEKTLIAEKTAATDKYTQCSVRETETEIFLTLQVKAKGKYRRGEYGLNSQIESSNNRREYIFDKRTNLIKSLRIYIVGKKSDVLILETTNIDYNAPVHEAELTALPEDCQWQDLRKPATGRKLIDLSPEEAARAILTAMSERKCEQIAEAFVGIAPETYNRICGGIKIIRIGTAFQSGIFPGWYVPYEIALPNGYIKKHNLALRNDNPNKVWQLSGGI